MEYKVYYISPDGLLKEPKDIHGDPLLTIYNSQQEALDAIEADILNSDFYMYDYLGVDFTILPITRF